MKKWLVPLAYSIISIVAFLLSGIAGVLGNGDGTGYGGVVIVLCGLIFYWVIVVPAMCIVYSKRWLSRQKYRFLFTLYQSFLIALPYMIYFSFLIAEPWCFYNFIFFAWCELWGLIGLIRLKREKTTNVN